jgi:hypothetical protein
MKTPRPTRRWLQFSLRALLVLVTLSAIPCSWLAVKLYIPFAHFPFSPSSSPAARPAGPF